MTEKGSLTQNKLDTMLDTMLDADLSPAYTR